MAQVKVSDLTLLATIATTDILLISEDLGGGNYTSKGVLFNTLKGQLGVGNTLNYVPKWNGSIYVDSQIFDSGTAIGINATSPSGFLHIKSNNSSTKSFVIQNNSSTDLVNVFEAGGVAINDTVNSSQLRIKTNNTTSNLHLVNNASANINAIILDTTSAGIVNNNIMWAENGTNRWAIRHNTSGNPIPNNFQIRNSTIGFNESNALFDIQLTGEFGFGTNVPTGRVHIKGLGATSSTKSLIVDNSGGTNLVTILDNGNLGVLKSAPAYAIDTAGDININDNQKYRINALPFVHATGGVSSENTSVGHASGNLITSAVGNTHVGYFAGSVSTTNGNNTCIGARAGQNNLGTTNTFVGYLSGQTNSTGNNSTHLGYASGSTSSGGSNNVYIGSISRANGATNSRNTFVGTDTTVNVASDSVLLGYRAGYAGGVTDRCVYIGNETLNAGVLAGSYNVLLGYQSGTTTTGGSLSSSVAVGGYRSLITKSNQMVLAGGGSTTLGWINEYVLGTNATHYQSATKMTVVLKLGLSTANPNLINDITADYGGHSLDIRAGLSTGNNKEGDIIFQTTNSGASGTTVNSYVERMRINGGEGYIVMVLPTSSAGLPAGALWNDSGTVKIV